MGTGEESGKGNEGLPSASWPHACVTFPRVSHGIAGTLLGEMALCAKKRPPGKTVRRRGGGSPGGGPPGVGVFMAQGAQGGRTAGNGSEGG